MYGHTYDSELAHANRTLYYDPRREEHIHGQHLGPTPFDAYLSNSYPMTVVSTLDPRGVLRFDSQTQYPSHFEQPFVGTYSPGSPEVGRSFPISQQVLTQTAFQPIGSGAPSGDPMPPGSSCAPPLHIAYSPAPPTFLPYDPRRVIFSVPPRRVDIQPQPVPLSIIAPMDHVQPSHTTSMLHQNRTSAAPSKKHSRPSKPTSPVHCPVCRVASKRRQERDRHLLLHLPCWIACSFDACLWRGDRFDSFTKHLYDEHQTNEPDGHWCRLYNTRPLVNRLVKGTISIEDAKQVAIAKVEVMALIIGKREFLEDPSGRKERTPDGKISSRKVQ